MVCNKCGKQIEKQYNGLCTACFADRAVQYMEEDSGIGLGEAVESKSNVEAMKKIYEASKKNSRKG